MVSVIFIQYFVETSKGKKVILLILIFNFFYSFQIFTLTTLMEETSIISTIVDMRIHQSSSLMLQVVVLQCISYTLILFLFQYRRGKLLITAQFLETAASTIFLETVADTSDDGKHHVKVRKSNASRHSLSAMTIGTSCEIPIINGVKQGCYGR